MPPIVDIIMLRFCRATACISCSGGETLGTSAWTSGISIEGALIARKPVTMASGTVIAPVAMSVAVTVNNTPLMANSAAPRRFGGR